jgi:cell division protein FtsQ
MKKLKFQILLYGSLTLFSWMIVGLGAARQNSARVSSLQPVILNEENNHFLGMDDVKDMVREIQERPLEECKQGEVKIEEIEKTLDKNPYVKKAEAFTDLAGNVVVELELRKPLARVMYEDGTGFYLDHEFNKVDLSNTYSANTPLVRGLDREPLEPRDTVKSEQLNEMREFLEYVDRSELLRSQVSEIVAQSNGDLVIYPEMGDVLVEFGKPTDVRQKFANMELFYRRVLNHTGWKKYRSISLKFKGQIVARRN